MARGGRIRKVIITILATAVVVQIFLAKGMLDSVREQT